MDTQFVDFSQCRRSLYKPMLFLFGFASCFSCFHNNVPVGEVGVRSHQCHESGRPGKADASRGWCLALSHGSYSCLSRAVNVQ